MEKIPLDKFLKNYENVIRWSNSKHRVFNECKRKFLYRYGGVLIDPIEKNEVEELKSLKTLRNWQGEIIHRYISIFMNTQSLKDTLYKLHNELSSAFKNPQKTILEFYYDIPISNSQLNEVFEISKISLENFSSYYNENIKQKKDKIISKDSDGVQSFSLEGMVILYRPDLVIKEVDSITIFDWKTSDDRVDPAQVNLYILVYHKKLGLEKIKFVATNLYPTIKKEKEFYFENDNIQAYLKFLKDSFYEIKNFWNELLIFTEQEFDNLYEEIYKKFTKTNNIGLCNRCEFKKLCFR